MNNFDFIDEELRILDENQLKRNFKIIKSSGGPWVELTNGKRVLQFASNNYLGLSNHPDVINGIKLASGKYSAGSTGSRLLSGTTELHEELEDKISIFEGSEATICFSSGYSTNLGVISALIGKDDVIFSDESNHASIIDGIRLSGASKFIYKHLDFLDLEKLISENINNYRRGFIITDTVFSMDGDIAPLKEIALISKKYNCINIVDEAHGTGVFSKGGRGVVSSLGLDDIFKIKIGTFSKAFGLEGGFCSGPKNVIELIKNRSRSFMFSTSPSPAIIGGILKALDLVKESDWRREKLWENAKYLHSGFRKNYKLKVNPFSSPIITINFKSISETLDFSNKLFDECHVWAPAIRPPTVREPRIRFTPISTHSKEDIDYVIRAVDHLSKDLKVEPLFNSL